MLSAVLENWRRGALKLTVDRVSRALIQLLKGKAGVKDSR